MQKKKFKRHMGHGEKSQERQKQGAETLSEEIPAKNISKLREDIKLRFKKFYKLQAG